MTCSDLLFLKDTPMPCKNSAYLQHFLSLQNPSEWTLLRLLFLGVASNSPKYQNNKKPIRDLCPEQ